VTLRLAIIDRVRRSPSKGGVGVSEWKRGSRTGANGRWAAAAGTFVELAASALAEADAGTTDQMALPTRTPNKPKLKNSMRSRGCS
jgi:hypothetical protein